MFQYPAQPSVCEECRSLRFTFFLPLVFTFFLPFSLSSRRHSYTLWYVLYFTLALSIHNEPIYMFRHPLPLPLPKYTGSLVFVTQHQAFWLNFRWDCCITYVYLTTEGLHNFTLVRILTTSVRSMYLNIMYDDPPSVWGVLSFDTFKFLLRDNKKLDMLIWFKVVSESSLSSGLVFWSITDSW